MRKPTFELTAQQHVDTSVLNRVCFDEGMGEIRLFEAPVVGYASAEDALFDKYLEPGVIGPHFRKPREWLSEAKTVISFFLPFSSPVRESNTYETLRPGVAWLYGRVEGQQYVAALSEALAQTLRQAGYRAVVPSASPDFRTVSEPEFTSNWSERHVAYACGLGTFGLSKGLITRHGMAGRFGSIVTDWQADPTPRDYTQVYEYCIRCGACVRRCPGNAISLEKGKDHQMCLDYQKTILPQLQPRFGCGLCQTGVPCEMQKP